MSFDAPTVIGWAGMILLVTAYGLRKSLSTTRYALFNLVGAAALAVTCYATKAWPLLALELVWAGIAIKDLIGARNAGTGEADTASSGTGTGTGDRNASGS